MRDASSPRSVGSVLATVLGFLLVGTTSQAEEPSADYNRDIKPILKARCFACHGALNQKGSLRVDTAALLLKGGDSGPAFVAGQPEQSRVIERISEKDESLRMPPEGMPLTAEEIAKITAWIKAGAKSPEKEQPEADPRDHWAFKVPVRPALPATKHSEPTGNAIDAFVSARLEAAGLTPRPLADKAVLLRRVTLDLLGVPPSTDELHAFLADNSPTAYETVVDRLLADPRYGERWARHWMDIWRYSDWYGRRHVPDCWNSAPQIWRWRDWIVKSLNNDHGYDRMLREMLAADEIAPEDEEAAVATGYLIRNWYALNPNDWMRNTVEHTGKAFLGLTFNCAHCHDHKYDPIAQDDYFHLRAFFEPIAVRQDRVAGQADPGVFEEYQYGKLRKIQRLGLVRIFDKTPDAPTWFYTGGDERNRVKDRSTIGPGVPAFLAAGLPKVEPVTIPPRSAYPGLRPAIQQSVLAEAQTAVTAAESEAATARQSTPEPTPEVRDQLAKAEAEYAAALREAEAKKEPTALEGRQSLLLDATAGRRCLQNGLTQLKTLEDGSVIEFELMILADAHVNFQLAKDVVKGLTAGFVGFEKGRILAYQPGSFTEFEAGRYDFAGEQRRFRVRLVLETQADRMRLTVRSLKDDKVLVDAAPVALNGWNPVGDKLKAISFDARTGCVAAVDNVRVSGPMPAGTTVAGERKAAFDFESPVYTDGRDVGGLEGWIVSQFSVDPATSVVSSTVGNTQLRDLLHKVEAARRVARMSQLRVLAADAKVAATRAELASTEARLAADRAKYGETPSADAAAKSRDASRLEREAAVRRAEADILGQERALADAEAKPAADANRAKEISAATTALAAARTAADKARTALADDKTPEAYTPFGPSYPTTSTGRRKALAEWMTSRQNPLTARVAINHIWARHFHVPLVTSVYDFGRNGAPPTHPELLDWLAVELMSTAAAANPQWRMKPIHRLIVTSAAYRRVSSTGDAAQAAAADPENRLLWRMNSGRMEAEVIRDSLLACAGKLDLTMGGQELENSEALTTYRRSLYYSVYPEEGGRSQLGDLFDAPSPAECYRRTRSIVPQQALALTNADLVHAMSTAIVAQWKDAEGAGPDAFANAMFERILSRSATDAERQLCREAIDRQRAIAEKADAATALARARESLVRALLNHNDFVTIR